MRAFTRGFKTPWRRLPQGSKHKPAEGGDQEALRHFHGRQMQQFETVKEQEKIRKSSSSSTANGSERDRSKIKRVKEAAP